MAARLQNTRTDVCVNKQGKILAHGSGWCAGPTKIPTRRVSEDTRIDWRMVGVAGVMAMLFVGGSVLAAWAAARPRSSSKGAMALSSPSREGAGLGAVANAMDSKDRSTNGTDSLASTKANRDGIDSLTASSDQSQPIAIYPEADNRVTAPAPVPGIEAERKTSPEPDCETAPAVVFTRDPMQAARRAREEHKLLMGLHVSGNFEESKFT